MGHYFRGRTFAAIINRCLSGKTSGLDKLRLSRAQILWGMYHQKYVDYVELLWEDFTYQIDNKVYKKQKKMYYPREVPPKVARKSKKASPSKKESELVPGDEEPVKKGKILKTPAKKSASKLATVGSWSNVAEKPPSVEKITPTVTSEETGDKPGVLDMTNDDSFESESESWGNDEDDSNNEQESSDESNKQENESEEQESNSEQDEESDDDD
ncbi:hypothetical protein Tco_0651214 [Tanacetum coccineum]